MTSSISLEIISIATPAFGKRPHQPVDFGLGADIDAARRLVKDHDLRRHGEPFGQHDLLLIAARERAGGRGELVHLDREIARWISAVRASSRRETSQRRAWAGRLGSDIFSEIGRSSNTPQAFRSSGTRKMPSRDRDPPNASGAGSCP